MTRFERNSLNRWLTREDKWRLRRNAVHDDTECYTESAWNLEEAMRAYDSLVGRYRDWDQEELVFTPRQGWILPYDKLSESASFKDPKVCDISLSEDVSIASLFGE